MSIIAQSGAVVNINVRICGTARKKDVSKARRSNANVRIYESARKKDAARARRAQLRADKEKPLKLRWAEHKRQALEVGNRLIAAGLTKRGFRIKMCGNQLTFRECQDCGNLVIERAQLCRDRLCPICNWRLALKRYSSMSQIMDVVRRTVRPDATIALMTYTVRNCVPEKLQETLSAMQRAWNRMLAQRYIRPVVIGWARSIEVTYNQRTKELHPHYHVIMICTNEAALDDLQADWLKQCRKEGLVVDIRAQNYEQISGTRTEGDSLAKSILETYKYMVKSSDVMAMPLGVLRSFAEAVAGRRLISFGGVIKTIARELEADKLDSAEDAEREITVCTRCGSVELDQIIAQWSMRGNHYLAISGIDLKTEVWA